VKSVFCIQSTYWNSLLYIEPQKSPEVTSRITRFNIQQDRQCTYNVTMGRLREIIVDVETQLRVTNFCVCMKVGAFAQARACVLAFSLTYPSWKAPTPYCHLWPLWLHHIFWHYLINGKTIETKTKKYGTQKGCFDLPKLLPKRLPKRFPKLFFSF
jgi:hypothetical protein